jgi:hydroxymethylglutaryl-CoA reductase
MLKVSLNMSKSSLVSGFYKLSLNERLAFVKGFVGLTDDEVALSQNTGSLPLGLVCNCCRLPLQSKLNLQFC